MATRKDVEDCRQTPEALAQLARKLGYHSPFGQLQFNNGAYCSDLLDFFRDNPGAIEVVLNWILEDTDLVDEDEEDEEEEEDDAAEES